MPWWYLILDVIYYFHLNYSLITMIILIISFISVLMRKVFNTDYFQTRVKQVRRGLFRFVRRFFIRNTNDQGVQQGYPNHNMMRTHIATWCNKDVLIDEEFCLISSKSRGNSLLRNLVQIHKNFYWNLIETLFFKQSAFSESDLPLSVNAYHWIWFLKRCI